MEIYRCFIAVDLPAGVKRSLAEAQQYLQAGKARIKWVEEINFHLTLKFLGEIDKGQVIRVQQALSSIVSHHRKSGFFISGAGAFPSMRNPKIIWAGIKDSDNALTALYEEIDAKMSGLGFPGEQKKFSPHITLGRIKDLGQLSGLGNLLLSLQIKDIPVALEGIKLMRSKLTKTGPEYSTIGAFELQEHF